MEERVKIKNFKDLKVWQEAHQLVILVYRVTKNFPREELYSLIDQMRRSAVSVTSNIAEGFSRHSFKEKLQFYSMAHGSLTELENQIEIAKDVGYFKEDEFLIFTQRLMNVHMLLNAFIKKTKSYAQNS
jgi:four helix bundle protein